MTEKLEKVNLKLSVSNANSKMGQVASISTPPIVTCVDGCKCSKDCYAARLCRLRKNVRESYNRNLELWRTAPDSFELQATAAACTQMYFRWHVAGDIIDERYLMMMFRVARACSRTTFLCFTKKFDLVNRNFDSIPSNLQIVFSAWPGMVMDNPHELPIAHVVFKGEVPDPEWMQCGGCCQTCAARGCGCWTMKKGEHICFAKH